MNKQELGIAREDPINENYERENEQEGKGGMPWGRE